MPFSLENAVFPDRISSALSAHQTGCIQYDKYSYKYSLMHF